jgi:hypothetical protein
MEILRKNAYFYCLKITKMSRHVLRTLTRAVSPGGVGLHSGVITSMTSLFESVTASLNLGDPISASKNTQYSIKATQFSSNGRSIHTTAIKTFAANDNGGGSVEQYDLLPPDTGIVRIEG